MKIKLTLILLYTFIPFAMVSQTKEQRNTIIKSNNSEKLESLKNELQAEFILKRAKVIEFARNNNVPLFYNSANGNYAELMDIIDDRPIYYTTFNVGSAVTSRANQLKAGGSLGLNLNGQNMIVGVWDANHPRLSHFDFANRVAAFDGDSNASNHSTHVTGTILSSGNSSPLATGLAPLGEGWIFNWTNDLSEMAQYAQFGLLVSNHSYGLIAENLPLYFFGAYISTSRSIDQITFAAPFYQPVIAAGNDRDNFQNLNPSKNGADLLTQYSTAKNAIVVAAVNGVNNYINASSVSMSGFSNFGPTDDLRIKPDIAAMGVNVISSTSTSNTSFGPLTGTSMAAPGVTGVIMLLQEYHSLLNGGEFMKSSTLRGLIANSADEAGPFDGPDAMYGWGLLNAEKAALTLNGNNTETSIVQELLLSQNQTFTRVVNSNGLEKLKVTISWTDRPGQINSSNTIDLSTPVLVNDLDLRITKNSQTFFPWKLTNGTTIQAAKSDNNVDNIEKVEVDNASGQYTITVTHKGNLVGSNQDYSLIVSGIDQNLSLANNDLGISIYPNPTADNLNFNLSNGNNEDLVVEIFDIQGRLVLFQEITNGNDEFSVSLESLNSGLYLVKVTQDSKTITKKILKN